MRTGDYVRTKKDGIGKIISFSYQEDDECCFIELSNRRTGIKQFNIIKTSPKIIDLIEIGDYVNGKEVFNPNGLKWLYKDTGDEVKNIKSIVTKEQFEDISYKVGE